MDAIVSLLKTGELPNFELAKMLIENQNIDISHEGFKELILCQNLYLREINETYRENLAELLASYSFIIQPLRYNYTIGKEYLHSKIKHLPKEIGLLSEVEIIEINAKYLCSIPPEIGHLSQLKALKIEHTKIQSLPETIGNLANIETLELKNNPSLASLPQSIGNLSSTLEMIDLENTNIKTLPKSILNLKSLTFLDLKNTQIPRRDVQELRLKLPKCQIRN